jgi:hypothetical protein
MKAVNTSEISVDFYQTTRRNIPDDGHIHFPNRSMKMAQGNFNAFSRR